MKRLLHRFWRGFNKFSANVLAPSLIGVSGVWIPRHWYLDPTDEH